MKYENTVLALLLLLAPITVCAFPFPIGHEEALMANVGVALPASSGNSLFNPAGLSFMTTDGLSVTVSGNALEQMRFELDGLDADDEQSNIRPTIANMIMPINKGYASVYVSNPIAVKILQSQMGSAGTIDHTRLSISSSVINAGAAYAHPINEKLGWGISAGGSYTLQEVNAYRYVNDSVTATTEYDHERLKNLQPIITPGILWEVTDGYYLGGTVSLLLPNIFAEGLSYKTQTNSNAPLNVTETLVIYNPSTTPSLKLSVGQLLRAFNQEFLLDINYSSFYEEKDAQGITRTTNELKDFGVGWRGSSFKNMKPLAGVSYSDQGHSDAYLYTAGVTVQHRQNLSAVGIYYQKNKPKREDTSPYDGIGLVFSSNVIY
ncbi:hypothetical protein ACLVWU_02310 [Bdellovibrio sp. HCB290]|uniref:hypothetical protein n=1 Tax=Bdellovibrio sp. HCB290 TaxID=3394356 RepID=UPI0039B4E112